MDQWRHLIRESLCNFVYDDKGRPIGCWFVKESSLNNHYEDIATYAFIRQQMSSENIPKSWVERTAGDSLGHCDYHVCVKGRRDSNFQFQRQALLDELTDLAEREAKRMEQEVSERWDKLSSAQYLKKWHDSSVSRWDFEFTNVEWYCLSESQQSLYEEAKALVYEKRWDQHDSRLMKPHLREMKSMDVLADRYAYLDDAGVQLGKWFQRFDELLKAMDAKIQQMAPDKFVIGPRSFCNSIRGCISETVGYTDRKPRNLCFLFGKRTRSIPYSIQRDVFHRDGDKCVICGSEQKTQLDHILPFGVGVDHTYENLRVLCQDCNLHKVDGVF